MFLLINTVWSPTRSVSVCGAPAVCPARAGSHAFAQTSLPQCGRGGGPFGGEGHSARGLVDSGLTRRGPQQRWGIRGVLAISRAGRGCGPLLRWVGAMCGD